MSITRDGCQWFEDGADGGPWETSCKHYFDILDGTPTENKFRYCCFCGRPLVEVPHESDNDD